MEDSICTKTKVLFNHFTFINATTEIMSIMDQLSTIVEIPNYSQKITYKDKILMAGSCFAEHMDAKLARYKYRNLGNPFGILYNPSSLAECLRRIANQEYYQAADLVFHDGMYHSMDHHGSFSNVDADAVIKKINTTIDEGYAHLKDCRFVFISLGTSRVYRFMVTGKIAGNNHKIPLTSFDATALSVDECISEMSSMYKSVKQLSPDVHLIWTVSPIRHLKDGLIENQRSKAVLILAIEKFISRNADTGYFPAYEIMVDQLRDYRFYARDLTHPSELAIDIIWDAFCHAYIETNAREHHTAMEKIKKAMEHRILHDNKTAIKTFAESQLRYIDHLSSLFPEMNWKEERQYFFHMIEPD